MGNTENKFEPVRREDSTEKENLVVLDWKEAQTPKVEKILSELIIFLRDKFGIDIDEEAVGITEENNLYLPIETCCRENARKLRDGIEKETTAFLRSSGYTFSYDEMFKKNCGVDVRLAGGADNYPKRCDKHAE